MTEPLKAWEDFKTATYWNDTDNTQERAIDLFKCDTVIAIEKALQNAEKMECDENEIYEIGKRDGEEEAYQSLDCLTGGDGEYACCTEPNDESHCPDAEAMKNRVVSRFEDLKSEIQSYEEGYHPDILKSKAQGLVKALENIIKHQRTIIPTMKGAVEMIAEQALQAFSEREG